MLTANDEAKIGDVGLGKLVANPNAIATQQGNTLLIEISPPASVPSYT